MYDDNANIGHRQYLAASRELSNAEAMNQPFVLITDDRCHDLLAIMSIPKSKAVDMIYETLRSIDDEHFYSRSEVPPMVNVDRKTIEHGW